MGYFGVRAKKTVVLAAGDFPREGTTAAKILAAADRVVCCDGAANAYYRHFNRWPDVVIGDLDSLAQRAEVACALGKRLVQDNDQSTSDLDKAVAYCALHRFRVQAIVGACGKREDHTLGNVFRAFRYNLPVFTDYGRFVPFVGFGLIRAALNAGVSLFAPHPHTHVTSRGLKWPLDGVKLDNLYCATLNRTTNRRFTLVSDKPIIVYVAEPEEVTA